MALVVPAFAARLVAHVPIQPEVLVKKPKNNDLEVATGLVRRLLEHELIESDVRSGTPVLFGATCAGKLELNEPEAALVARLSEEPQW